MSPGYVVADTLLLSNNSVDVNAGDLDKKHHIYILGGSAEVNQILLANDDVDADAVGVNGQTPFHVRHPTAAQNGQTTSCK